MINLKLLPIPLLALLNGLIIIFSVLLCSSLLYSRLPGLELLGIAPQWLLIWVVSWSVHRTPTQGVIAGVVLGLIQDGMVFDRPLHTFTLAFVGWLTARLQKQRYIQEDFISIALIVFGMCILEESLLGLAYWWRIGQGFQTIWTDFQKIALTSSILSSLWAPVIYYPLNLWWRTFKVLVSENSKQ